MKPKINYQYADFKFGKIAFTVNGKGRAVVLLHGFLGSSQTWELMTEALSKNFKVICIDLPGHGQSECFGYTHSMELMAQSVKAVMDTLRLKKYVIIGHSMGGYTGLAFAELYPDFLRGLRELQKKRITHAATFLRRGFFLRLQHFCTAGKNK